MEGLGHDLLEIGRPRHGLEAHQPRASGRRHAPGHLGQQPGLAHAGRANDADESVLIEQAPHGGDVVVASEQRRAAGRHVARRRDRGRGRRPTKARGLLQQLALEGAQVGAGLDAELVDQKPPHPAVRRECVGLPAPAIQSRHQRGPQPLAERVTGHQHLELADELAAGAEVDPSGHDVLEQPQPDLLEPGPMGRRPVAVVEENLAAEEPERLAGQLESSGRVAGPTGGGCPGGELDHSERVDAGRVDLESVLVAVRHDEVLLAEGAT